MSSLGPETFKGSDEKAGPKKKQKGATELDKAREVARTRSKGLCEVRTRACTGRGSEAHHVLRRSQGGSDDPSNLLWACLHCHDWLHKHPAKAYEKGWMMKSGKK